MINNTIPLIRPQNLGTASVNGGTSTQQASGVSSTGNVAATDNVTLTAEQNQIIQGSVSQPELENGTIAVEDNVEAMEDLEDVLDDICDETAEEAEINEIANGGSSTQEVEGEVSTSGMSVVSKSSFSIYALMSLMTELSHDVKQASREVRYAELEVEQSQILARADYQRKSGLYGMITGIVLGCIQLGVTAVSAGVSMKGSTKQLNMRETSSVTKTSQNLAITEQCSQPGNNAVGKMQSKAGLNNEQATALKNQYFGEAEAASTEYTNAKNAAPAENIPPEVQRDLDTKQGTARSAYDEGMNRFDNDIAAKETQVKNLKSSGAPKSEIKQAKSELKTMKKQRGYMKAVQVTGKNSVSTTEQIGADLNDAITNEHAFSSAVESDPEFVKAGLSSKRGDMGMQLGMSLSGIFNGITQYVTTEYNASATEEETLEKESEQELQMASEMMQSAQGVMDSVLQLARSIVDIENSTNQKIITG